jgi:hypothetical protein
MQLLSVRSRLVLVFRDALVRIQRWRSRRAGGAESYPLTVAPIPAMTREHHIRVEGTPKVVIHTQFSPPTPMITLQGPSMGSGLYRAEFLALPEWCTP